MRPVGWLRRMLRLPDRTQETIERADELEPHIKAVRITIVPKNDRALAELRRLEGHARR